MFMCTWVVFMCLWAVFMCSLVFVFLACQSELDIIGRLQFVAVVCAENVVDAFFHIDLLLDV